VRPWRPGVLSIFATLVLGGCATNSPVAASGLLQVFSATYAPTTEQSEYPVHTDYTIETTDDRVLEHVRNLSGSFNAFPARVTLTPGQYHVKAQYDGGKFVVFPVDIAPGRITTVNLDNDTPQSDVDAIREPIRLPGGREVGWCTMNKQR